MKKTYFFLLSVVVFGKCFSTDVLSDDEETKGSITVGAVASPKAKKTNKIHKANTPLRLEKLDPKRSGSWYTEHEIGEASSMLQGVKQKDDFLMERPASVVKKEQLKILTNHFGKKRGKKIYYAIIIQETSMRKTDVKAMKQFVKRLHVDDQKAFQEYIATIKQEIPTVDRKNMKENAKRCEGIEIEEDALSFIMAEGAPFVLAIRNGRPVGVLVSVPRLPNGEQVMVREGAFVLRVGIRP